MSRLFRYSSAGRMDFGMGWFVCRTMLDAPREHEPLPAWKSESVSTVNRGSPISGAGNSFE